MLFEWFEKEATGFGDSTADDDGFWVEEPAAVHERCGEHFGDAVPDAEGDFISLLGELGKVGGFALGFFARGSCGLIGGVGKVGDLLVADVVFEGSAIAIGSIGTLVVDGGLAEFSGDEVCTANHASVDDDAATNSGAEGEGDEVIHAATGAAFPLGISHAVGVVLDGDREVSELVEFALEVDSLPTFDVGEVMNHAGGEVDEARHADADGFDAGVLFAEFLNGFVNAFDERGGAFEFLGLDARGFFDEVAPIENARFYGSSAEVDADG